MSTEIWVRFRRRKLFSREPREWENDGEIVKFKSWKKAWEYIDDECAPHPDTGKRIGTYANGDSLKNHTRKINVDQAAGLPKGDLWILSVFGVEEKAEQDKFLADLEANLKRIKGGTE